MKFSDFLNESMSTKSKWEIIEDTVEFDYKKDKVSFSISLTPIKGEQKDSNEFGYVSAIADFSVENYQKEKQSHDSPGGTEYDIEVGKIVIDEVYFYEGHDFPDYDSFIERFKKETEDKTKLKNILDDMAEEVVNSNEYKIVDEYEKYMKNYHDDV